MSAPGKILITGGSGFLGVRIAQELLARQPGAEIVLSDIATHARLAPLASRVRFVQADLAERAACEALITPEIAAVYHFASLVSGGAERDFEAGLKANVSATLNLLEACRRRGRGPRFVFPSSIAAFGGAGLPQEVTDETVQHPQNSYGVAKVLGEQLLNDYSRKGFICGRGVRLPAIVVRDEPNTAASGYVSALFREPLHGRDYVCPVKRSTRLPLLSVRRCTELLVALGELPAGALGDFRTINGPSLSPSAGQLAAAVRKHAPPGRPVGKLTFAPDPAVERLIAAWPRRMRAARAAALGLHADASVEDIVKDYVAELSAG